MEIRDRRSLKKLQESKLRSLLAEVLSGNSFYAQKFRAAGVEPAGVRDPGDLVRLPFTTKDDLQADQVAHPPHGSNLTYPPESYVRLHQTSGSTGQPICWLDTAASWSALLDCWQVIYDAAGVVPGDRLYFPFSFGPFIGFWAAFDGGVKRGQLCVSGGGLSSAARLHWIVEQGITVMACTPTYALRLAEVAADEGIDLAASRVRVLIVAGEPGGSIPAVRGRIEEAWGGRCVDHWGMTEVGPLGFEPLERPGGMHLLETHCIAEIVDPGTGEPLDGEAQGELVITTLERVGSPVIRYRTGDLVHRADPAAAPEHPGSEESVRDWIARTGGVYARLEGGILSRTDHMVLVRGNNVYPGAIDAIVRQFREVLEYRAEVVKGPASQRLVLTVELDDRAGSGRDRFAAALARAVQDRLFFRPHVVVVGNGALPRHEFKARRFLVREEET